MSIVSQSSCRVQVKWVNLPELNKNDVCNHYPWVASVLVATALSVLAEDEVVSILK